MPQKLICIGFIWTDERQAQGVWFEIYQGDDLQEILQNWSRSRKMEHYVQIRTLNGARRWLNAIRVLNDQGSLNINAGLTSFLNYADRVKLSLPDDASDPAPVKLT